ncbi:MAG: universal stress protein [Homoserinimonas sp.]
MVEKVIVAVDGGAASDAAVEWVIERSKSVPMEVEITTVVELGWLGPGERELEFLEPYRNAVNRAFARFAEASPDTRITTRIKDGSPADVLAQASEHADLLVVGTNKTGKLAGVLHGTLPLKIAGRSTCPTVVVPVGWSSNSGSIVAAWDNDETAEAAVDFATAEAERLGRHLVVVHAWRVPATIGTELSNSAAFLEDLVNAHARMLRDTVEGTRAAHPTLAVEERLEPGPIAVAVVETAAGASLLVVGSHGKGVIRDLVLGSVSHDVLLNMPAPVAVVPRPVEPIKVYPEVLNEDLL